MKLLRNLALTTVVTAMTLASATLAAARDHYQYSAIAIMKLPLQLAQA